MVLVMPVLIPKIGLKAPESWLWQLGLERPTAQSDFPSVLPQFMCYQHGVVCSVANCCCRLLQTTADK